jgi:hypothetical protein
MKSIIFLIIFLLLNALPVFSQTQIGSGGPLISFVETEYNFGTVKSGVEAIHYFVFTNSGSKPLVISNIRSSCGCAVPGWPKIPIESGRTDSLRVEYNTRVKGVFDKTISVYTNDARGMAELRIKGNVVKTK